MSLERLRIFISSPGDVAEERVLANNLVRRLADEYADRLWIEPVFWEHEPLLATDTFQKQIPPPHDCEVVVCMLWSRLGTRLPADITRPDGTRYASGTEYEFEDAAEGFRRSGRPELLVYRKTATPLADLNDKPALLRRLDQKESLDVFFEKWFINREDGTLKAAFHGFAATSDFERLLDEHLRKLINRRLPTGDSVAARFKPSWTTGSPFRGLDFFDFEHAPIFCGRTKAIGDLLNALRANALAGRAFVLVIGVSGGGKSSLVRAGVLPVLVQPGVIEGVGLWRRAVLKPSDRGGDLLQALAGAVLAPAALPELGSDGTTIEQLTDLLRQSPAAAFPLIKGGLSQAASALARGQSLPQQPEARLVVVVDQLEELFTLPDVTPADRQGFVAALSALARSGKVWVIATLRGDFYHRAFTLPELVALQEGMGLYALPSPGGAEIGQMIRQPARAAGLAFEEDPESKVSLDEVLCESASVSPESLPLLEFALEELYQRQTDAGLLTYAAYRELGGVEGALTQRAEAVFAALHQDVQAALPRVMRGLVRVGDGEGVARQQAALEAVAPTPQAKAFVEAFVQARLFAADRTEQGQAVVRVTHEALLRTWPRLQQWLDEDREMLLVSARVSAATARWQADGQGTDFLLGEGKPLAEAESLAATLGPELPSAERALIAASQKKRRTRALMKRIAVAALVFLSGVVGVTIATAVVFWGLYGQTESARQQAEIAKGQADAAKAEAEKYRMEAERLNTVLLLKNGATLAVEGEAGRGILWMARSLDQCPNSAPDLNRAIRMALASAAAKLHTLQSAFPAPAPTIVSAISPDGKTVLLGGKNTYVVEVDSGKLRFIQDSESEVSGGAFSPGDGKLFATSTMRSGKDRREGGLVRVGDSITGADIGRPIVHPVTVKCVVFSPDGKKLLVAAQSGKSLQCYDLATREPTEPNWECKDNVYVAVYSPDGELVATAARENNARLWNARTGKAIGPPIVHPGVVFTVAFSPDSKKLATGCRDGGARLWDVKTGQLVGPVLKHRGPVRSAVFSRKGRRLLTSSEDGTARLWEVSTGEPVGQPLMHSDELRHALWARTVPPDGEVRNALFMREENYILTAGFEGTARLWRIANEQAFARILPHSGAVSAVAFSPNGKQVLTGTEDSEKTLGEARLWNAVTGDPLGKPMPQSDGKLGQVMAVAFSPDGKLALTGGNNGEARLWDTATSSLAQQPWHHGNIVAAIAFSPDGSLAAISGQNGVVEVRDLATGQMKRTWRADSAGFWVWSIAFTDNQTLLTGGGLSAQLWRWSDKEPIGKPMDHKTEAHTAILSPGRQVILTAGHNKLARLWSARDGQPLSDWLVHKGEVRGGAFRPDGKVVATAAADGTLRLWEVPTGRPLMPPLFHDDWVRSVAFSPDGKTLVTACEDGFARLWSADDGASLGAVLRHRGPVNCVAFSPDGKSVLTGSNDGTARLWTPPPGIVGEPKLISLWAQVLTGMELDKEGTAMVLPREQWQQRRRLLEELGGLPKSEP
jgi:WD40 repeat protein